MNNTMSRLKFADFPILPKRESPPEELGWWFGTIWPDWPEAGPYATRAECEEARSSLVRNWIGQLEPQDVSCDSPRRKAAEFQPSFIGE